MKFKKIVSALLAVSMVAAFAGCSKVKAISEEDFINACENLGAEEIDSEDVNGISDSDREDGVYMIFDSDYIEENLNSNTASASLGVYGMSAPSVDQIVDPDDIEEMVVYLRMTENTDDISGTDDIADLEADIAIGMHITLSDADQVEDIMEGLADVLDDTCNIDVKDLSSDEYYLNNNQAYMKVHVDAQDIVAAFLESDIYDLLSSFNSDMDDLEDALGDLNGGLDAAFYINGENIVIVFGVNINEDPEFLNDLCSELGIADPSKLSSNEAVAQGIIDYIDDTFGSMIAGFSAMASYDY